MKNMDNKRKAVYYFGANEPGELLLLDMMKEFEKELANFRFVPVVSEPEESEAHGYETGLVTDAVERGVKNAKECEAYLCGSPGMINAVIKVLVGLGVSEERIFYDKFE